MIPIFEPRTTILVKNYFKELNIEDLLPSTHGLVVLNGCIPDDYRIFQEYLGEYENQNIPRNIKTAFIDGTIYIIELLSPPREQGVAGLRDAFLDILTRLGRRVLTDNGSRDHRIGGHNKVQPDISYKRNGPRTCANFIGEVAKTQSTQDLLTRCIQHFNCLNINYVLGIDILDVPATHAASKEVRLMAYLFRRHVNTGPHSINGIPEAPEIVVSFGNHAFTPVQATIYKNDLVQTHFQNHPLDQIAWKGLGFDPQAPPCNSTTASSNAANPTIRDYYKLFLLPALILEGDVAGVQDNHGIDPGLDLDNLIYLDLYEEQRFIRRGFFEDGTFADPMDTDLVYL